MPSSVQPSAIDDSVDYTPSRSWKPLPRRPDYQDYVEPGDVRSAADDRCLTEHGFIPDRPVYTHCKGTDKAPDPLPTLERSSARSKKVVSAPVPAKIKHTKSATALAEPVKVKSSRRPLDQYKGIIIRSRDGREVRRSNPFASFGRSEAKSASVPVSKSSPSDSPKDEVKAPPPSSTSSSSGLGRHKVRIIAKDGRLEFVDVALPLGLVRTSATDVQSETKSARSSTTVVERNGSTYAKWANYKATVKESKSEKENKPVEEVQAAAVVSRKNKKKIAKPEKQGTQKQQELTPDDSISQVKMSGALPASKSASRVTAVEPPSVPAHDSGVGLGGMFDTVSARASGVDKAGSKLSEPPSKPSSTKRSVSSKTAGISVHDWDKKSSRAERDSIDKTPASDRLSPNIGSLILPPSRPNSTKDSHLSKTSITVPSTSRAKTQSSHVSTGTPLPPSKPSTMRPAGSSRPLTPVHVPDIPLSVHEPTTASTRGQGTASPQIEPTKTSHSPSRSDATANSCEHSTGQIHPPQEQSWNVFGNDLPPTERPFAEIRDEELMEISSQTGRVDVRSVGMIRMSTTASPPASVLGDAIEQTYEDNVHQQEEAYPQRSVYAPNPPTVWVVPAHQVLPVARDEATQAGVPAQELTSPGLYPGQVVHTKSSPERLRSGFSDSMYPRDRSLFVPTDSLPPESYDQSNLRSKASTWNSTIPSRPASVVTASSLQSSQTIPPPPPGMFDSQSKTSYVQSRLDSGSSRSSQMTSMPPPGMFDSQSYHFYRESRQASASSHVSRKTATPPAGLLETHVHRQFSPSVSAARTRVGSGRHSGGSSQASSRSTIYPDDSASRISPAKMSQVGHVPESSSLSSEAYLNPRSDVSESGAHPSSLEYKPSNNRSAGHYQSRSNFTASSRDSTGQYAEPATGEGSWSPGLRALSSSGSNQGNMGVMTVYIRDVEDASPSWSSSQSSNIGSPRSTRSPYLPDETDAHPIVYVKSSSSHQPSSRSEAPHYRQGSCSSHARQPSSAGSGTAPHSFSDPQQEDRYTLFHIYPTTSRAPDLHDGRVTSPMEFQNDPSHDSQSHNASSQSTYRQATVESVEATPMQTYGSERSYGFGDNHDRMNAKY